MAKAISISEESEDVRVEAATTCLRVRQWVTSVEGHQNSKHEKPKIKVSVPPKLFGDQKLGTVFSCFGWFGKALVCANYVNSPLKVGGPKEVSSPKVATQKGHSIYRYTCFCFFFFRGTLSEVPLKKKMKMGTLIPILWGYVAMFEDTLSVEVLVDVFPHVFSGSVGNQSRAFWAPVGVPTKKD